MLSLGPKERLEVLIEYRDARLKALRRYKPALIVMDVFFSALAIFRLVRNFNNAGLMNSLGFLIGIICSVFGFRAIMKYRARSFDMLQGENFTDEDAMEYFREQERINQCFRDQWKSFVVIPISCVAVFVILTIIPETQDLASNLAVSALASFVIQLTVLSEKMLSNFV
jgi:hypothetical protein